MKAPVGGGGNFDPAPAGNQIGRLVGIYHFGMQEYQYQGEDKTRDEIRLTFELPNAKREFKEGEGEQPYMISKTGTYSMHSKAFLRQAVEACIGVQLKDHEAEAFDVEEILGKACLINVGHYTSKDGNERAGIEGVSPLIEGIAVPDQINESVLFDVLDYTPEQYNKLPDWMKEKVDHVGHKNSSEEKPEISPDDIPF